VPAPQSDDRPARELLKRLEREIAPIADSMLSTRVTPRSILSRVFARLAIAVVVMAFLATTWQQLPSDARQVADATDSLSEKQMEISRLREALANAEMAQISLRAEFNLVQKEMRSLRRAQSWTEDSPMLTYRSPWKPR
jgi:hypothetical protein